MTTEMQTFISPDEIIGLRFQCTCGATITIPLTEESKSRLPAEVECPSCPQKWFEGTQDQRRVALLGFMNRVLELQSFKKNFRLGVTLEIASGVRTPSGFVPSRDSGGEA